MAGCGGGGDERAAVEDYIRTVNRAQAAYTPAFGRARWALGEFAQGRANANTARLLRGTWETMRNVKADLTVLRPPEAAAALHADLLRLVDLQAWIALELSLAAEYLPAAERAIRPADGAADTLRRALADAGDGAAQADALRAYAGRVQAVVEALAALAPPPVLRGWHDGELAQLRASRRLALDLAGGIDAGDDAAVQEALRGFREASPDARAVAKAQVDAVRAFNRRLGEQEDIVLAILRRRAALAQELAG